MGQKVEESTRRAAPSCLALFSTESRDSPSRDARHAGPARTRGRNGSSALTARTPAGSRFAVVDGGWARLKNVCSRIAAASTTARIRRQTSTPRTIQPTSRIAVMTPHPATVLAHEDRCVPVLLPLDVNLGDCTVLRLLGDLDAVTPGPSRRTTRPRLARRRSQWGRDR
jgi:hypothetical protein